MVTGRDLYTQGYIGILFISDFPLDQPDYVLLGKEPVKGGGWVIPYVLLWPFPLP